MARGDVVLVSLPLSDRREQSGRRPAIAVQTDQAGEPMLMVAPVTSKSHRSAFLLHATLGTLGRQRTYNTVGRHGFSDESNRQGSHHTSHRASFERGPGTHRRGNLENAETNQFMIICAVVLSERARWKRAYRHAN